MLTLIACLNAFTHRVVADERILYELTQDQADGGWGYPEAGDQYSAQKPSGNPAVTSTLIQQTPNDPWESVPELIGAPNGEERLRIMSVSEPQGFLGHEVTLYGRFYDSSNILGGSSDPEIVRVGPGVEIPAELEPSYGIGEFDFESFSIGIDESLFAERNFTNSSGTFNGYVIEDTNDTLPDFLSATIDESVSTRTSTTILVSPNSIWINDESLSYEANAFLRIQVTFADGRTTFPLTINPSPSGDMLVEAAARVGSRYQFEHSTDLMSFAPIDSEFTATAPFVTTFIRPEAPRELWRLQSK